MVFSIADTSSFYLFNLKPRPTIHGVMAKKVCHWCFWQIVAACALSKGQEIFNTFGELENSELVCKYGFALPNNPFNSVHLSKSIFLEEAKTLLGRQELKKRQAYLETERYGPFRSSVHDTKRKKIWPYLAVSKS